MYSPLLRNAECTTKPGGDALGKQKQKDQTEAQRRECREAQKLGVDPIDDKKDAP
jgi:hypothetical protein